MLLLLHSRVVRRRLCHDVWRGWVVPRLLRGIGELHGGALLLRVTVGLALLGRVGVAWRGHGRLVRVTGGRRVLLVAHRLAGLATIVVRGDLLGTVPGTVSGTVALLGLGLGLVSRTAARLEEAAGQPSKTKKLAAVHVAASSHPVRASLSLSRSLARFAFARALGRRDLVCDLTHSGPFISVWPDPISGTGSHGQL